MNFEIEPSPTVLVLRLVEADVLFVNVLGDPQFAGNITQREHRTVFRALAALGTKLLPLSDDQPRRFDGKIRREKHAEGKLIGRVFLRD